MSKCLVCVAVGRDPEVDDQQAEQQGLTSEYQGRTYYFNLAEHKRMFEQDPEGYLKMAREKGLAE